MELPRLCLSLFWSFFMHLFLLISSFLLVLGGSNETDKLSLLAFKAEITEDPFGILSPWNESQHFCNWPGITCGKRHQRVTMLVLQSSQLKGPLSPHVGNLSFLTFLDLQNNSFSHNIPSEIGRLRRLRMLHLETNSFSEIPVNISSCSNLEYIGLSHNNLAGKLTVEIDSLSKLRVIDLGFNYLVGEIPPSYGNLSALEKISLQLNNIHGRIPESLGNFKSITRLILGTNNLTGTVPSSIFNLTSLTVISLLRNQLEGNLPSDLGHTLPNLEIFYFHTNHFSGPIPPSISNATNLVRFEISINNFTGKVPSLASLSNLEWLGIDENSLGYGKNHDELGFLSSLVNCTNLEILAINGNNFGGALPESISNYSTKVKLMVLGRNQISGIIPTGIGNLINLEGLTIENNQLTGPIPSSIGKLYKLNDLFLSDNILSGTIPHSLGNLTSLGRLVFMSNNLQGSIPSSLGECRHLLALDLSHNNLSGIIPKEVISLSSLSQVLNLSRNNLNGPIPMEVGKLVNLGILDISENRLSGEIPESLGSCTSLEKLHLEGNLLLHGNIPESFSSLRGLEEIDLSHNNLSGKIPTFLGGFQTLKYLNLSFNNFEGELPTQGVFKNVTSLSISGNTRLCGGIPQLSLPKCSSSHPKGSKLSHKLKLIISIACGAVAAFIVVISFYLSYLKRKRKSMSPSEPTLGLSSFKVSYGDLLKATDGFSSTNLIGVGSFGSVYKGILDGERLVAVKVLKVQIPRASKSFIAECEALRGIRHRNLVKLLTACSSIDFQGNNFKALVYEFMVNGSLENWLHQEHGVTFEQEHRQHLNLTQRLNIAIDVASALDYLHNHCCPPIVHCDLKPSNILLDSDMTARLGDFGLARFLSAGASPAISTQQTSSIGIKGSIGYAAPEYGMGSEASTYGDVYSYGILLLEMFTGKRPTNDMFKDEMNLHNFVKTALPTNVEQVLDPKLFTAAESLEISSSSITNSNTSNQDEQIQTCLISIARIGVDCSTESPRERIEISKVVAELCSLREVLLGRRM